tara:strand:+ start:2267 stop:3106 length:840 start_codon:yes stop_codon:yes gene_type:complete
MYYVATSWDESGSSPTQEQIDNGIQNLKRSPMTHAYNVCCWQPHLADPKLIDQIWQWIEYYTGARLDYGTMPLADKQVWWLITPEPRNAEFDKELNSMEIILRRQEIINQIKDPLSLHNKRTHQELQRAVYPRIYMQVQSMVDYMYREHAYVPIILNKPFNWPIEFNYEFGSYFEHVPVLPVVMSTFHSKPKYIKHNGTRREMLSTNNGSLTAFKTYPATVNVDGRSYPSTYKWQSHDNPMASKLSQQGCIELYRKRRTPQRPLIEFDQLEFNLSSDLI